jgi:hypothetical protein
MAEAKSKSKTPVVCTLCDKPITTGKPVMIDDDPYHSDCAKAMEQSAGATETEEEDEEAEEAEEEEDGEDESDEDEEDEDEDEKPAPRRATKVAAKAPAKSAKRVVAEEDDDEDEDDEDDEDDEEEEEEVVVRPAAKKAAAPAKKAAPVSRRAAVEEDDEDDDDDEDEEEEEEEVVVRKPVAKAAAKTATKPVAKRAAADYEEEDEPEERPRKAKSTATATKVAKKPAVDVSGWGNPATLGSKRYFVYQALKEVTKTTVNEADGPGKPENVVARAKRLQRDYARENKITLSEKDKNYSSMNIGWIYNHADELKLVMRTNPEAGTYRILKAAVSDDSD